MHVHNYWWNYVHSEGETVHLNGEKHSPNMESYMLPCFHLILWQGSISVFAVLLLATGSASLRGSCQVRGRANQY